LNYKNSNIELYSNAKFLKEQIDVISH